MFGICLREFFSTFLHLRKVQMVEECSSNMHQGIKGGSEAGQFEQMEIVVGQATHSDS